MYYRNEDAMAELASHARLDPAKSRTHTYTTSQGRAAWLPVERVA
jgi:hypothetical protein